LGFIRPTGDELPDFDKRPRGEVARAKANDPRHRAALGHLKEQVADAKVDLDDIVGTPRWVRSERGTLSGPNGRGLGVPARAAAEFGPNDPHRAAKAFLKEHHALFGHGQEALAGAKIQREFVTPHSGLKTVVWEQRLDDIPVFGGLLIAHTTRNDELVSLSSRFHPSPEQAANTSGRHRGAFVADPGISAKQAVAIAARSVQEDVPLYNVAELDRQPVGAEKKQRFKAQGLPGEARARLVWLPMDAKELRLCWEVLVTRRARGELYQVLIDARSGEALLRHCLTAYLSDATYRVWTSDSPSPFSPGWPTPNTNQPPFVPPVLVTTNAVNTNASPAGWINDGDNETRGNNVDAHLDRNADDAPDLPRPQGSPSRVFDLKVDLTESPSTYGNGAVVQLFYWCNWMHDKLYELGFTEAAGNFQVDNFGRGGAGGDPVMADAQDGSGTDNANFATPPDGESPRMQMFLFGAPSPDRDGDLDAEVILHEYTHGLSNRRVGGGVGISALQTRGLGEGWSDFYALALLSGPGDDLNGVYAAGGYISFLLGGERGNYYFGIRRYPYSTDMTKNPLTFKDIDPSRAGPHPGVPHSVLGGAADEVHSQGEVWCVTLWEARARLIERYGWETGNQLILRLVTDGMNLAPADPNFLEARDAIIQADFVANCGANFNELWAAFAKRGMGASATSPASSTTAGVVEAFNAPDDLLVRPASGFIATGPDGGPFTPNGQTFTLTNIGTNSITWTATQTNNWLDLSSLGGTLSPGASADVTASIQAGAASLASGIYFDTVRFSNQVSGIVQTRSFLLRIGQPDFFTELFDASDNDLAFHSVLFTPNGSASFYGVCRQAVTNFPTDPTGGTSVSLSDDSFVQVTLSDTNAVSLYAKRTNTLFIGSNGYLTFDLGDQDYTENFPSHFLLPRVAALFDDLDPAAGGSVSWKELSNRVAVTWQDVPQYGTADTNSFQIELFYDDAIRITWLALGARDGLAGLSDGSGVPVAFLESDFNSYGPCAEPLLVSLPSSAAESAGLLAGQGQVRLVTPVATNVVVSLASSDVSEASVPASVTILAGETNATFDITVQDDALLDGPQVVVVRATAPPFATGTAVMAVLDDETAALQVALPASTAEGVGTVTGWVQVSRAPDADILVQLTSSDTTELQVPPGVLLRAGQTSAVFIASVVDDTLIDGAQAATITAFVPGWTAGSAAIAIFDNESLNLMVRLPARVIEGQGTIPIAGQVRLAGTLPTNLVVSLASDAVTELIVPATTTVPAGQLVGAFDLTVMDDALIDGSQVATVTASADGFGTGSAGLVILDDESPPEPFSPNPPHLASDVSVIANLSWRCDGANEIANGGFESGDFAGWQQNDTGSGGWFINGGTYLPFSGDGATAPFAGGFSTVTDQTGPGRHELFQEIVVPVRAGPVMLRWMDRLRNFGGQFTSNQYFRVEVCDVSSNVLAIAYATQAADALFTNWVQRSFDLGPFRGQTVRVAFIEEDALGYFNVHLDNVSIEADSGGITNDVYFGTNPIPGPAELVGSTTNTAWDLPRLAPLTTYYWQIVARRGGVTPGPIWQFTTRGVDHFTLSAVPTPQLANQPFMLTVTAKDASDTTVTNYTGPVRLAGFSNDDNLSGPFSIGPTNTGAFTNGVWTGPVTVFEAATNMFLLATDGSGHRGAGNTFSVLMENDLAVSLTDMPDPVALEADLTYSITITNNGPSAANSVTLASVLPPGAIFISATESQGSCTNTAGVLSCSLGSLSGGTAAAVALVVHPSVAGFLTNTVTIDRDGIDPFPGNNLASAVTHVIAPNLSINDVTVTEGDSGATNAVFNVQLSPAAGQIVSVAFMAFDGTATAGLDYAQTNGVLVFSLGETNKTVTVPVYGDTLAEPTESFYVQIFSATNAGISDPLGVGLILNDDPDPAPLRIVSIVVTNGFAALRWVSVPGETYRLEYTTDLGSTNWTAAGHATATAASVELTNQIGADPQRFYRIVRP
jgi:uncharacterized repeat protein (TIGR01451 family)